MQKRLWLCLKLCFGVNLARYDSDSKDQASAVEPLGFVEFCVADLPFDKDFPIA